MFAVGDRVRLTNDRYNTRNYPGLTEGVIGTVADIHHETVTVSFQFTTGLDRGIHHLYCYYPNGHWSRHVALIAKDSLAHVTDGLRFYVRRANGSILKNYAFAHREDALRRFDRLIERGVMTVHEIDDALIEKAQRRERLRWARGVYQALPSDLGLEIPAHHGAHYCPNQNNNIRFFDTILDLVINNPRSLSFIQYVQRLQPNASSDENEAICARLQIGQCGVMRLATEPKDIERVYRRASVNAYQRSASGLGYRVHPSRALAGGGLALAWIGHDHKTMANTRVDAAVLAWPERRIYMQLPGARLTSSLRRLLSSEGYRFVEFANREFQGARLSAISQQENEPAAPYCVPPLPFERGRRDGDHIVIDSEGDLFLLSNKFHKYVRCELTKQYVSSTQLAIIDGQRMQVSMYAVMSKGYNYAMISDKDAALVPNGEIVRSENNQNLWKPYAKAELKFCELSERWCDPKTMVTLADGRQVSRRWSAEKCKRCAKTSKLYLPEEGLFKVSLRAWFSFEALGVQAKERVMSA